MMRTSLFIVCLVFMQLVAAQKPPGFLWYNLPKQETPQKKALKGRRFSQLSYQQQDAVLAYYTREAWHKAMNKLSVENMRNYIALQDFWSQRATKTSRLFEKTMLYYPEFHYESSHPSNNIGVKISDELRLKKESLVLKTLAKTHGLLYFYRGANPYDKKENLIIDDFSKRHGLRLLPIAVDGVKDDLFPQTRMDKGQAKQLNIRFFPALILVNPSTQRTHPVSYGLVTQDMLARQFVLVATDFAKGDL
ncbi:conjugative transfer protein TraF [Legionella drozanskii LLAP-1]|uniref:Conjugative transfer protein TraF n=1 Tax=Legionella drozanskii LLAP-1 TaxID=1212489 RepID=A0A0W0SM10_9GAMM|nr:type-F conjugative transfer system pilin assembly protein TraF [Legionella drozanskii]KTC84392.1 conjugative transfer protein TraF [Legionella drozanskii LLAP-1]